MKKLFLVLMLVSLVALLAVPAMASQGGNDGFKDPGCNVSVDVNVYKRATFCENTYISKDLNLNVWACIKANQWAQATIQDCQTVAGQDFSVKGTPGTQAASGTFSGKLAGTASYSGDVSGLVAGVVFDDPAKDNKKDNNDHRDVRYSKDCDPKPKVDIDPFVGVFKGEESGSIDMSTVTVSGSYSVAAKTAIYVTLTDAIDKSFNGFVGIAQVNQAAGSGSNQGNALAAAVTDPNSDKKDGGYGGYTASYGKNSRGDDYQNNDPKAVSHTEVAIGQLNTYNDMEAKAAQFSDAMNDSFQNFTGVAQVNQSAGFGNNQKNAAAIAANVNTAGAVAISDSFMSQTNCANCVTYGPDTKVTATIAGSFTNGAGLAQVNQSPGSLNNQANTVAISYSGFNH
jgi:hypothetical protein